MLKWLSGWIEVRLAGIFHSHPADFFSLFFLHSITGIQNLPYGTDLALSISIPVGFATHLAQFCIESLSFKK